MNLLFHEKLRYSELCGTVCIKAIKKQKLLLTVALFFLVTSILIAQPAIEWDRTYEPGSDFTPNTVCATDDGGIIVGQSVNSTASNYAVTKYNAAGEKEWNKVYGGEGRDVLSAIIQTSDGGYLLGGTSGSNKGPDKSENSYSGADYWIIKISANGTRQWDKTLGGSGIDNLTTLKQTTDGGYIVGGSSLSPESGVKSEINKGEYDYWVVKITSNGTKEWDKTIGGSNYDQLVYVDQTANGNYILGGYSVSSSSGENSDYTGGNKYYYYNYWIVQLSKDGLKLWDKTIGSPDLDILTSMQRTSDGGYILGGQSASPSPGLDKSEKGIGGDDFWVVKINANGKKLWDKTIGGKANDLLKSIKQTSDGGYIIGGDSESGKGGNKKEGLKGIRDYWVVKLTSAGKLDWEKTIGGAANSSSELLAAIPAWGGGYLLCGNTTSEVSGNDKTAFSTGGGLWVVKLLSETNTKALAFSSGALDYVNTGSTTTPPQSVTLSANTGTPAVNLKKTRAEWLTLPAPSRGTLPFSVKPKGLSTGNYSTVVTATSPGYARALLKINLVVNDATTLPVLEPIGDKELSRGDTLAFTANATSAFGQTKVFSLVGAPQGATIGASSGVFSWVPQSPGTYQFVVKVSIVNLPQLSDEETITVKVPDPSSLPAIRINAGGGIYTASDGRVFEADQYYEGIDRTSTIADVDILNTTDDELYRSGRSSDYFNYNIPVTNGIVKVTLHFAEIYWGVFADRPAEINRRLFNVSAEGAVKLNNYSIIGRAGGALRAVQETFEVEVIDGVLNLAFRSTAEMRDKPRVSAIEVEFVNTTSISPVADADVSYGVNANTNYGNEPTLSVKATSVPELHRVSFLKFSLAGFSDITGAKFRIYGYNHQADTRVSLNVAGLDNDDWTETGITASNAPAGVTTALGTLSVTRKPEYFELGITEFAKAQLARDKTLTLRIDQTFGGKRIIFNSRENAVNRPELIINTIGPVGSVTRLAAEEVPNETAESGEESSVIYPNPVRTHFTLHVGNQHQEAIALQLFNEAGRAYNIKTHESLHAGTKAEISIADLSLNEGIYLLKVQSVSKSEVLKVVVVK
ncbi:DNRLRE domain-containing protein [Dyadobacter flavalbus]|uniref:DNRLRE domain-containing protein n=1 Tax=Dyadobacter flavalbus TaxID=2579942 RepID=A0A5M8QVG8_9BACT|nr:malectin domain-containing carbohydrate-binding protein [Dyadobacter flavalbus]KAA6438413.1 DNRLRE domain-containing protein [Dyadobacter flavalbus]